MTARSFARMIPYALPGLLLIAAFVLVASQVTRPAAVLDMWRPWGETVRWRP